MRYIYHRSIKRTEPAVPTNFTYDERVRPGEILVLRSLCVTFTNIATTEGGRFFAEIGGVRHYIGDDLAAETGGVANWSGCVSVGEGDRVGVQTAGSAATDIVSFWIIGEMWDLKAWRKANS